jgi:hypothetical protein
MKPIWITFVIVLAFFLGCKTESEPDRPTYYIIKVDSVIYRNWAVWGDTMSFKLYGVVGTNGCCSFSHFEEVIQPSQVDLTVWAGRSSSSVCPAVMVYLNGKEYRIVATPSMAPFVLVIHQPDGSVLRDTVIVK